VVGKEIGAIRAVINGAGSAGISVTRHLMALGLRNVIL
jgi:malate dehydrogenase (oxaloacetate-decarboxylating)